MTPRQLILRRYVALAGIALALMASLQESHALCAIANCSTRGRTEKPQAQRTRSKCDCCCHRPADSSAHTGFAVYTASDGDSCGSPCYDWRTAPRDVPRNVAHTLQSQITSLVVAFLPDTRAIDVRSASLDTPANRSHLSNATSSGSTCALLCRFLT